MPHLFSLFTFAFRGWNVVEARQITPVRSSVTHARNERTRVNTEIGLDVDEKTVNAFKQARDAADRRHNGEKSRVRSNSGRQMVKGSATSSDMDARHKVASLTAQLMQRDHRIRGLEQAVATKLAEASFFFSQIDRSWGRGGGLIVDGGGFFGVRGGGLGRGEVCT